MAKEFVNLPGGRRGIVQERKKSSGHEKIIDDMNAALEAHRKERIKTQRKLKILAYILGFLMLGIIILSILYFTN